MRENATHRDNRERSYSDRKYPKPQNMKNHIPLARPGEGGDQFKAREPLYRREVPTTGLWNNYNSYNWGNNHSYYPYYPTNFSQNFNSNFSQNNFLPFIPNKREKPLPPGNHTKPQPLPINRIDLSSARKKQPTRPKPAPKLLPAKPSTNLLKPSSPKQTPTSPSYLPKQNKILFSTSSTANKISSNVSLSQATKSFNRGILNTSSPNSDIKKKELQKIQHRANSLKKGELHLSLNINCNSAKNVFKEIINSNKIKNKIKYPKSESIVDVVKIFNSDKLCNEVNFDFSKENIKACIWKSKYINIDKNHMEDQIRQIKLTNWEKIKVLKEENNILLNAIYGKASKIVVEEDIKEVEKLKEEELFELQADIPNYKESKLIKAEDKDGDMESIKELMLGEKVANPYKDYKEQVERRKKIWNSDFWKNFLSGFRQYGYDLVKIAKHTKINYYQVVEFYFCNEYELMNLVDKNIT